MRKLIIIFIIAGLLLISIPLTKAQMGGGISIPNFLMLIDSALLPIDATWSWGSAAVRIAKIWVTDIDISGILTLGGVVGPGGIDLNGNPLILDADGDTLITADTDDQIDFEIGGSDLIVFKTSGMEITGGLIVSATTTLSGDLEMKDDQYLYFDTAKSKYIRYSTDHGTLLYGDSILVTVADLTIYSNSGADAAGTWEPSFTLSTGGVVTLLNTLQGNVGSKYFRIWMTDGIRLRTGGANADAIILTDNIASTPKTFQHPNISGTYVTTNGALANIDIGAYTFAVGATSTMRTIMPESDSTYSLGSSAVRWLSGYFDNLYVDTMSWTGDLDMAGNLVLNIGSNDTDFTSGGGLNIATDLDVGATLKVGTSDAFQIDATGNLTTINAITWNLVNSQTSALNIESGLFNIDTQNARVGIGTTTPSTTLEVVGTITATTHAGDGSALTGVGLAAPTALTLLAKVNEGGGISKGQCVYQSGATGQFPRVSLCDNTDEAKHDYEGIAAETKADNQTILIRVGGELTNLDTDGTGVPGTNENWADSDALYMSTVGNLTNVAPTSGVIEQIANVTYAHGSQGKLNITHHQYHGITVASGADLPLRMGDNGGSNYINFKDYANNIVGWINSNGVFQTGADGQDGQLNLYSEQGGTDYTTSLFANTSMTSNASFYFPADEPAGTYLLNMTSGGVMGFDSSTYLTASPFGADINVTELAVEDFGDFTCNGTTCSIDTNAINDTHIDWGTGANQVSLIDLPDVGSATTTAGSILIADGSDYKGVAISGDATIAANGTLTLNAKFDTDQTGVYLERPVVEALDEMFSFMNAITITRVWCWTDTGTVTLNVENASDADVLSSDLVCDADGQSACASGCDVNTINLSNDNLAAYAEADIDISATASSPNKVSLFIGFLIDD